LYIEGVRRVRVEHASILGYLEPVSAPLYALVLLGEAPAATTLVGGALIVVAGLLIVRYGAADVAPEPGRPPLVVRAGDEAEAGGEADAARASDVTATAPVPLARDAKAPPIR
ncbi:MAG: EamA family transporter, partial [Actinomycetota bacterium]